MAEKTWVCFYTNPFSFSVTCMSFRDITFLTRILGFLFFFGRDVCPYLISSGNNRLRESMQLELASHGIYGLIKVKFEVDCTKWFYEICQSLFIFSSCI